MADLETRTIDWIDDAPVRIEAHAESDAPPEDVFAVLADHARWPEWFPGVKKVTVTGEAAGVGATRRVAVPGATIDERFIVWEPGARFSFTGVAARPRFTRSLVEDCRLERTASGGTDISYTMYLDPTALVRPVTGALVRRVRANNATAMTNLARRAATTGA